MTVFSRPAALGLLTLSLLAGTSLSVRAQDFATKVVSSSGLGSNKLYNDPTAVLGQPTTLINGAFDIPRGTYHASLPYAPYNKDPQGNNLIATLGDSGAITVAFDTPITHSSSHWFGDDFLVFGNTFFPGNAGITPTTDMTTVKINSNGGIYQNGTPLVSVSADGISFTTLTAQSAWFPTNPFKWVGISAQNPSGWDDTPGHLNDFTKPVNPALTPMRFGGDTVADAANRLYDGSAGGAAFTLAGSGLDSINFIRFTGGGFSSVIDAVSRVSDAPQTAPVPEASTFWSLFVSLAALAIFSVSRKLKRNTQ